MLASLVNRSTCNRDSFTRSGAFAGTVDVRARPDDDYRVAGILDHFLHPRSIHPAEDYRPAIDRRAPMEEKALLRWRRSVDIQLGGVHGQRYRVAPGTKQWLRRSGYP